MTGRCDGDVVWRYGGEIGGNYSVEMWWVGMGGCDGEMRRRDVAGRYGEEIWWRDVEGQCDMEMWRRDMVERYGGEIWRGDETERCWGSLVGKCG